MEYCEIPRWKKFKSELDNSDWEHFNQLIKASPAALIIDVRTSEEYESGHLDGAININYLSEDLVDQLEKLDPDRPTFVYCRTSRRSVRVCTLLKNMGFQKVVHLGEGLQGK